RTDVCAPVRQQVEELVEACEGCREPDAETERNPGCVQSGIHVDPPARLEAAHPERLHERDRVTFPGRRTLIVGVMTDMAMTSSAVSLEAEHTDEEVVQLVLGGNTPLFELLMRRHNERLYRAARAITRDDREAEDVMQQAYVNAYS